MDEQTIKDYLAAKKMGMREYNSKVSKGKVGYLPFLDGLLKNTEIITEVDLGLVDVPLRKIIGTLSHSRSMSFASNFMPLMRENTEFAGKWAALSSIHVNEGIRDPIKVYEYLNWFYVVEGNKRVSVLKYFEAYSIPAYVSRLIPKRDEKNPSIVIYYEFLQFYKKTGINAIWFSKKGSFKSLLKYIENFEPEGGPLIYGDKYRYFVNSIYLPFRKAYHEVGGEKLPITTGDAFLEYIKLYGIPVDTTQENMKQILKNLKIELEHLGSFQDIDVQKQPSEEHEASIVSTIATFIKPKKILRAAFVYAKTIQESNWTNSHEWGRRHVERTMKGQVTTSYIENVPEGLHAYEDLKDLAEQGNDIIFATSPVFINATLKTALEYPEVRFFNCSQTKSFKRVNTYFGRIYEPRFLAGIVAGSSTRNNILGYVGTHPISEVVNGINSFALGARMVNPRVKVKVAWTNEWDSSEKSQMASSNLIKEGADIISHHNTLGSSEFYKEFGVYSAVCNVNKEKCVPAEYLATPVWNWGIFYEKMLNDILNDTWKSVTDIFGTNSRLINYWWGMDSGIVDIFYSKKHVPRETQKLLQFLKRMIETGSFQPFTGPIYDQNGKLRIEKDEFADHDAILSMDWLVDIVESEMPKISKRNIDAEIYVPIAEDED